MRKLVIGMAMAALFSTSAMAHDASIGGTWGLITTHQEEITSSSRRFQVLVGKFNFGGKEPCVAAIC